VATVTHPRAESRTGLGRGCVATPGAYGGPGAGGAGRRDASRNGTWTGGWWGYDPTNDMEIAHRHVWVAVGRDYADVPPLKGICSGGVAAALDVTVDMTRLA